MTTEQNTTYWRCSVWDCAGTSAMSREDFRRHVAGNHFSEAQLAHIARYKCRMCDVLLLDAIQAWDHEYSDEHVGVDALLPKAITSKSIKKSSAYKAEVKLEERVKALAIFVSTEEREAERQRKEEMEKDRQRRAQLDDREERARERSPYLEPPALYVPDLNGQLPQDLADPSPLEGKEKMPLYLQQQQRSTAMYVVRRIRDLGRPPTESITRAQAQEIRRSPARIPTPSAPNATRPVGPAAPAEDIAPPGRIRIAHTPGGSTPSREDLSPLRRVSPGPRGSGAYGGGSGRMIQTIVPDHGDPTRRGRSRTPIRKRSGTPSESPVKRGRRSRASTPAVRSRATTPAMTRAMTPIASPGYRSFRRVTRSQSRANTPALPSRAHTPNDFWRASPAREESPSFPTHQRQSVGALNGHALPSRMPTSYVQSIRGGYSPRIRGRGRGRDRDHF